MKKPKFISIIWGYHKQIYVFHREQNYHMLPIDIMQSAGYDCEIFAINAHVKIEDDPNFIPGTNVIYYTNFFSYIFYLLKNRKHILYSNTLTIKTLLVGIIGERTLFMPHDSIFGSSFLKKIIIIFFYRFFSHIRVNNLTEVNELDRIKKGLGICVPLVVSHEFYQKKIPLHGGENILISLGNLIPKKRPEFLLQALAIVKNKGYSFRLKVIGEDRLKNHYSYSYSDLVQKYGLSENIEVCGFVPHAEILPLIENASVYINTSIQEGFCLALYEMSIAGLFPIIPRILSFDGVFQDGALYYDPFDHEELAEHIMKVLDEKEKFQDLAQKNQEYISEKYSYQTIKLSLERLLLSL